MGCFLKKNTAARKNISNINSENEDLVESETKLEAQKQEYKIGKRQKQRSKNRQTNTRDDDQGEPSVYVRLGGTQTTVKTREGTSVS